MNINPKIVINDKTYKLPNSFTIEQWVQLMSYNFENSLHWPKILGVVTGEDPEVLKAAKQEALELTAAVIVYKMNLRKDTKNFRRFDTLLFGEFIDLDIYIAQGMMKNMSQITKILCPKLNRSDEVLWVLDEYVKWRTGILKMYKVLFNVDESELNGETNIEDEDEAYDPMALARAWYATIVELANWDVLKLDAVTDLPLMKALNFMALKKQRTMEELAALKKQKQKYDLQRNRR